MSLFNITLQAAGLPWIFWNAISSILPANSRRFFAMQWSVPTALQNEFPQNASRTEPFREKNWMTQQRMLDFVPPSWIWRPAIQAASWHFARLTTQPFLRGNAKLFKGGMYSSLAVTVLPVAQKDRAIVLARQNPQISPAAAGEMASPSASTPAAVNALRLMSV